LTGRTLAFKLLDPVSAKLTGKKLIFDNLVDKLSVKKLCFLTEWL